MECVSEPDFTAPHEAVGYLEALRSTLLQLGVSDVKMEEGSLRCDANVSIRPAAATELGTKTEIKNMNSFRSVHRAIESEIERQIDVLEGGGRIVQETRGWDEAHGVTHSMRSKEQAHDYRYFPDPDLVPIEFAARRGRRAAGGAAASCRGDASSASPASTGSIRNRRRSSSTTRRSRALFRPRRRGQRQRRSSRANFVLGDLSRLANESGVAVADRRSRRKIWPS